MTGLLGHYDPPLQQRSIDLMLLALAVAMLPHLSHLPPIVTLLCIAFGAWRWMAAHHGWALPGMPVRTLLTVLALSAVFLNFGTVFGRDAGAALLAIMLGLKLLEVRRFRDAVIVLFLGYFLIVTMVLFSQDILVIAVLSAATLLITMALINLNHPTPATRLPLKRMAGHSGKLLLQAVPLMLVMFLLFPRIPGPMWGLPDDAYSGMTGLSETMSPGSISELGQSDAVAFRVRFDDEIPATDMLYWRGPVFWHTDGREWSIDARRSAPAQTDDPGIIPRGPALHYDVTLEPHNQRWLFSLEMPVLIPDGSSYTTDLLLLSDRPVRQMLRYRVGSYPAYRTTGLNDNDRARGLQLPSANPRTHALGRQWRADARNDREVIQRALDHFRTEPFHYTLRPPLLGSQPVDDFLFDSRRGFCEHYAAAFTTLMRAAGIPTRVVTGYQGGQLNPLGDYLIVRQRDAHAWAEVWLDDSGWVRIDPTAAVAPHRIEQGSFESLLADRDGLRHGLERGIFGAMIRQAGFGWDAVNNRWNQWVLGYGPERQFAFLSRFGIDSRTMMGLTMIAAIGICLLLIACVLLLRRRAGDDDPAVRLYRRFCDRLARRGIVRAPTEGPEQFAARARTQRPDLASAIEEINRRYVAIRYGGINTPGQLRSLRREIARFHP